MSALRSHWARPVVPLPMPQPAAEPLRLLIAADDEAPARVRVPKVVRIARVRPDQQVMVKMDIQSVSYQLGLVARYLDGLLADGDEANDVGHILRAHTFSEGFLTRTAKDRDLRMAILWAIAERPDDGGYAPLEIDGQPPERIAAIVVDLWRAGHIDANVPKIYSVLPGGITRKGLRELDRTAKRCAGAIK